MLSNCAIGVFGIGQGSGFKHRILLSCRRFDEEPIAFRRSGVLGMRTLSGEGVLLRLSCGNDLHEFSVFEISGNDAALFSTAVISSWAMEALISRKGSSLRVFDI